MGFDGRCRCDEVFFDAKITSTPSTLKRNRFGDVVADARKS